MVARVLRVDLARVRISAPRHMPLRVILFDFFGTLAFLSKKPSFQGLLFLLKRLNFNLGEATGLANSFLTSNFWNQDLKSWEDFVRAVLVQGGKKPKQKLVQEITGFLQENVIFKLYEDTKYIESLPFRKAILTTAPHFLLQDFSLREFEKVFTPEKTKAIKPDPKAFLAALNDLKVSPEETIMVGDDLERDIIPARKLGINVVLIDRKRSIKKSPVRKIHSLKELKKAIFQLGPVVQR